MAYLFCFVFCYCCCCCVCVCVGGGGGQTKCIMGDVEVANAPCFHMELVSSMTTTNRIISSQALIIIRSKRNTFIIRNQNKHKSNLDLVAKFRKLQCQLTSVAGRYNSRTLRVSRVF